MRNPTRALLAAALTLSLGATAAPGSAPPPPARAVAADAPLTPRERGALARAFVLKFGPQVQARYGTPVGVWARRSVRLFVGASPADFRAALARSTPEAALAQLMGHGDRVTDATVRAEFARAAKSGTKAAPLGPLHTNLTFTAVQPCRVVDSRQRSGSTAPFPANSIITYVLFGTNDFLYQGGANENCGMPTDTSAVAINVTVVYPDRAGYTTVYPFGTERPLASSLNYATGAIVNNTVVTAVPNPYAAADIVLYTYAQAHYVIDVVGYYAPASARPTPTLDCTISRTTVTVSPGAPFVVEAECPATHRMTGGACQVTQEGSVRWTVQGVVEPLPGGFLTQCAGQTNPGASPMVVAHARCCRIVAP